MKLRKKVFKIISIASVFLISILLAGLTLLITVKATFFNGDYYLKQMQQINYSEKVLEKTNSDLTSLGIPGGIPDEVITNVISATNITSELSSQISERFASEDYEIQTAIVREKFMAAFVEYAESEGIKVTKIVESGLNNLATECANVYAANISFPFISEIASASAYYNKMFTPFVIGIVIVVVALGFMIWHLQRWKHRAIRYYIYGLSGTGVICALFPILLYIQKPYNHLMVSPEYIKQLLVAIANDYLLILILFGLLFILLAAVFIPYYKKLYKQSCNK